MKQVCKDAPVSCVPRTKRLATALKTLALLCVPLLCLLVAPRTERSEGPGAGLSQNAVQSQLYHLAKRVTSLTSPGSEDGSESKPISRPTEVVEASPHEGVSDDLAGVALGFVDMIFRLPEKSVATRVQAIDIVICSEEAVPPRSSSKGSLPRMKKDNSPI